MPHPSIAARNKLITLVEALAFSGAANVVTQKRDVFERPGAAVYLAVMRSEALTMDGYVGRSQLVAVVIQESYPSGSDPEAALMDLGLQMESIVRASEAANEFGGCSIHLHEQSVETLPDQPMTGVLTQIYNLQFNQTL